MFKKSFSTLNYYSRRLLSVQMLPVFDWVQQEKILIQPFEYIEKVPCKHHNWMAPAFNHWLQVPEEKLNAIQKANQSWISWNILLDDIQDDSAFRYGVPAAHRVFGVGVTINAANKALLLVQKQIKDLEHPLAPELFEKRMEGNLHGQGIDLYWRDNNICPTEDTHIEMAKKKAGSFFVLPVELMQLFSSNNTDYTDLATNIGIYYEILDDYYNLFHPKTFSVHETIDISNILLLLQALPRLTNLKQVNHVTCSDITEGKFSLSVIHALQFPDVATELADILKQRTSDPKLQNRVIVLLQKHGSDEYTRKKLMQMEADIRMEIDQFGGNSRLSAFMDDLSFQTREPVQEKELYT